MCFFNDCICRPLLAENSTPRLSKRQQPDNKDLVKGHYYQELRRSQVNDINALPSKALFLARPAARNCRVDRSLKTWPAETLKEEKELEQLNLKLVATEDLEVSIESEHSHVYVSLSSQITLQSSVGKTERFVLRKFFKNKKT